MATGKRRISLAVRGLAARVAGSRVLVPERAPVAAEPEHDPVAAEREHDPVAVELEHAPGVEEPEHDPVAVELELVPVVAVEPELAQVVAEPARGQVGAVAVPGHQRARVAVAARTKSVTAAHRRGLPLLVAEDLAVVAETTPEPAATEAATAWEAAE
jgi:hypothetical protein